MENQEIMKEAVEATEVTTSNKAGKAGLAVAILGGIVLVGGVVYKAVIKPIFGKGKAKKAEAQNVEDPDAWKEELQEAVTDEIE